MEGVAGRGDVMLVRWPEQAERREQLARSRIPRLLVVASECAPPVCDDVLEDWVREPLDPDEVDTRAVTLARPARVLARRPHVDGSGAVWMDTRRLDLPVAQVPVVRLLVARFEQVVPVDEIRGAYVDGGGSVHPKAFRAMIGRVKRRMAELDLCLTTVRDRGYVLERHTRPGDQI